MGTGDAGAADESSASLAAGWLVGLGDTLLRLTHRYAMLCAVSYKDLVVAISANVTWSDLLTSCQITSSI